MKSKQPAISMPPPPKQNIKKKKPTSKGHRIALSISLEDVKAAVSKAMKEHQVKRFRFDVFSLILFIIELRRQPRQLRPHLRSHHLLRLRLRLRRRLPLPLPLGLR